MAQAVEAPSAGRRPRSRTESALADRPSSEKLFRFRRCLAQLLLQPTTALFSELRVKSGVSQVYQLSARTKHTRRVAHVAQTGLFTSHLPPPSEPL